MAAVRAAGLVVGYGAPAGHGASRIALAAGAVVAADVPPRTVVMGVPGRVIRQVPDEDLIERWR